MEWEVMRAKEDAAAAESGAWADWQDPAWEDPVGQWSEGAAAEGDVAAMYPKGKGKGGKANGGFHGSCHNCGEWGHSQKFCPYGTGKGKGNGNGKGKGKWGKEQGSTKEREKEKERVQERVTIAARWVTTREIAGKGVGPTVWDKDGIVSRAIMRESQCSAQLGMAARESGRAEHTRGADGPEAARPWTFSAWNASIFRRQRACRSRKTRAASSRCIKG